MNTATLIRPLLTVDEARALISQSALDLARHCRTDHAGTLTAMLWGSGPVPGLHHDDSDLAMRHRGVLDEIAALGYLPEAHEELDGVASAIGLTNGIVTPPPF